MANKPSPNTFYSKVAGVTAKNTDGRSRQKNIRAFCKPGKALILKREPKNPYDPNAVGVWVLARVLVFITAEMQIGYLNKDVAREVAPHMDAGGKVTAKISEVTGGTQGKSTLGVNIALTVT